MKLYLITRKDQKWDYDEYDSAVVAALSGEDARFVHPQADEGWEYRWNREKKSWEQSINGSAWRLEHYSGWVTPDEVTVKYIGESAEGVERGSICGSFNAG